MAAEGIRGLHRCTTQPVHTHLNRKPRDSAASARTCSARWCRSRWLACGEAGATAIGDFCLALWEQRCATETTHHGRRWLSRASQKQCHQVRSPILPPSCALRRPTLSSASSCASLASSLHRCLQMSDRQANRCCSCSGSRSRPVHEWQPAGQAQHSTHSLPSAVPSVQPIPASCTTAATEHRLHPAGPLPNRQHSPWPTRSASAMHNKWLQFSNRLLIPLHQHPPSSTTSARAVSTEGSSGR